MKKIVTILVFTLAITITAQTQKGKRGYFEKLTPEQKTTLILKKMTLELDLTASQINQLKPLLIKRSKEHQAIKAKRKAIKENNTKLTTDERYTIKSNRLDKKIAFKRKMKEILNKKQYEKFEKMAKHKMKRRKKGKHKAHKKQF